MMYPDLDPVDWEVFGREAHAMLDRMLAHQRSLREQPVWQPIPDALRQGFREPSPLLGHSLEALAHRFFAEVVPYSVGNAHPGFMGWVHGAGTPVGMMADLLASGLNANLGGRDHVPVEVEKQIVLWAREWFGFPETATGVFTTGTSLATLMAVWVARAARWGESVRMQGWQQQRPRVYASTGVHGSLVKALDLAGMGRSCLVTVATDAAHRMDLTALEEAIEADRRAGYEPFMVVGSAGTVDTGAIDDLAGLAACCAAQRLWFHVDGALGALACWSPILAPLMRGIERADSLAFDFHKWGQVPYDAGFLLVREGEMQRQAFSLPAEYLARATRGTAAGTDWPCDLGPDLSRGFRALKTWMTLQAYGTRRLGETMEQACHLARQLGDSIDQQDVLERMAPVSLNIVCFRYRCAGDIESDLLNERIAVVLQESGLAVVSTTRVKGRRVLRAAVVNHRTQASDLKVLLDGVLWLGQRFSPQEPMA